MKKQNKKVTNMFERDYLRQYQNFLREVRVETFHSFPKEYKGIIECVNDSIDFFPKGDQEWDQAIHSLSGILRCYLWKLTNWIAYEILNGKYFEASRNLRFLLEGSIWSIFMEDAIEDVIFKRTGGLSELGLKNEIIHLWKKARKENIYKEKNQGKRKHKAEKIVRDFFREKSQTKSLRNMTAAEQTEYIQDYALILSNKRLGYSIRRLIDELKEGFLPINPQYRKRLKDTWANLCESAHFPGFFFEEISKDVDFIFVEKLSKHLFTQCFRNYLTTLDLFYSVVLWRWEFPQTVHRIKRIVKFWQRNLKVSFELTQTTLRFLDKKNKH